MKHFLTKTCHSNKPASILAFCIIVILSSCKNPMADYVSEFRSIAASPAIALTLSPGMVVIEYGSTHDLGTIAYSEDESQPLLYIITIKNSGNSKLLIEKDTTCLTAPTGQDGELFKIKTYPEETISPGTSSTMEINLYPKAYGSIQATLVIPSNDYTNPSFTVTIKANVQAPDSINQVATPISSVATGAYSVAQSITLSCATPDAIIRYKTDGTSPSASSGEIYAGETINVPIGGIARIRAIAYKTSYSESSVLSADIQVKPGVPGILAVGSSTLSLSEVSVTWSAGLGASGYIIGRGLQSDGSDRTTVVPGPNDSTTSFIDVSANPGTTYYYWVKATSPGGDGDWSPVSSAVTTKTHSTAWARTVSSGDGLSSYVGIAVDTSDNSYYAIAALRGGGNGYDNAGTVIDYAIGGQAIAIAKASAPESIPVLVKYDQYGSAVWVRSISSVSNTHSDCRFTGVSVNSVSHTITVVGYTVYQTGTFNFPDSKSFTTTVAQTAFIMQFSSVGTINWLRAGGGTGTSMFRDIAADSNGNAFAIGSITGTVNFSGQSASTSGGENGVIVKYGSDGTVSGVLPLGSVDTLDKAVVDAAGNLYCTGTASVAALGYPVTMKYNSSLQNIWTKGVTITTGFEFTRLMPDGLWVDNSGIVYVASNSYASDNYYADIDWGNGKTTHTLGSRPYLIKYQGSDGTTLLAKTLAESTGSFNAATSNDYGNIAIASDPAGNIYVATTVMGGGTVDFGNGVLVTPSFHDGGYGYNTILVKYSGDGTPRWAQSTVSATQDSLFYDLVYTGNGSLIAAGMWRNRGGNSVGFGNVNAVSGGYQESNPAEGENVLLVKYNTN